jgi:uncharacterized protein (TIGR01370 family)
MRLTALAAAALAGVALAAAPAAAQTANPRLAEVRDWAFALGVDTDAPGVTAQLGAYDLVVVDGESSAASVAALRAQGSIVLGYLSVGTLEPYRPGYKRLKKYRLPVKFEEFDEDYARVSAKGYRRAIARRIAPRLLANGFDGLFLDNFDMILEFRKQRRGMYRLVEQLSALVRANGGLLFAQNGAEAVDAVLPFLDGWNREDVTSTYSFKRRRYVPRPAGSVQEALAELGRIRAAGLLVTAADYVAAGDVATEQAAIANACSVGALPFVSNINLTRLPAAPLSCP